MLFFLHSMVEGRQQLSISISMECTQGYIFQSVEQIIDMMTYSYCSYKYIYRPSCCSLYLSLFCIFFLSVLKKVEQFVTLVLSCQRSRKTNKIKTIIFLTIMHFDVNSVCSKIVLYSIQYALYSSV